MPLNSPTLSAAMRAAMLAAPALNAVDGPELTALCDAIASTVVAHIVAAGVVTVVTACPAGAGTGTGTVA
jgi:hypothetical protein